MAMHTTTNDITTNELNFFAHYFFHHLANGMLLDFVFN